MKISIKVREGGWIIEAIARQWQNELSRNGHEVKIDFQDADRASQIHIHFIADEARPVDGRLNIVFVTHLDFYWKILNCIQLHKKGVSFICMSKQTERVLRKFMPRAQIFAITPQSLHFGLIPTPKKITFGLFFRLYDDNRKNRDAIELLVNTVIENSPKASLLIYGAGFEGILRGKSGNSITYFPILPGQFDVDSYRSYLRMCDYVVSFGRDEGAISILDAATLGIPVLATNQGYHRDLPLPTGSLLLDTAAEICKLIEQLIRSKSGEPSLMTLTSVIEKTGEGRCSIYEYYALILRSIFVDNPFYLKTRFTRDKYYNYKRSAISKVITYVLD
jgi:hypothetical protein